MRAAPRARPPRSAPAHLGRVGSTHAHIKDAKTMDVMIFKGAQVRSAREHSPPRRNWAHVAGRVRAAPGGGEAAVQGAGAAALLLPAAGPHTIRQHTRSPARGGTQIHGPCSRSPLVCSLTKGGARRRTRTSCRSSMLALPEPRWRSTWLVTKRPFAKWPPNFIGREETRACIGGNEAAERASGRGRQRRALLEQHRRTKQPRSYAARSS